MPAQTRTPRRTAEHHERRRVRDAPAPRTRPQPSTDEPRRAHTLPGARWKWVLAGIALATFVAAYTILRASFFAINSVQVTGEARTTTGAILDALDIGPNQALATYDTTTARDAIADLPWVDGVQVSRRWPSTLRVTVRERTPAAAIGRPAGTEWVVVSDDGHVLERRLTPPAGLPLIAAPVGSVTSAAVGATAVGMADVLAASLNLPLQLEPWIQSWSVDSNGAISAELVGSATALFGRGSDHRTQYVSLASILDGDTSLACIRTIDLTIADTPVIEREPQCVMASRDL